MIINYKLEILVLKVTLTIEHNNIMTMVACTVDSIFGIQPGPKKGGKI